jgi:hypothetical protein
MDLMAQRSIRDALKWNTNATTPAATDSTPTGKAPQEIHARATRCAPPRSASEPLNCYMVQMSASSSRRVSSVSAEGDVPTGEQRAARRGEQIWASSGRLLREQMGSTHVRETVEKKDESFFSLTDGIYG